MINHHTRTKQIINDLSVEGLEDFLKEMYGCKTPESAFLAEMVAINASRLKNLIKLEKELLTAQACKDFSWAVNMKALNEQIRATEEAIKQGLERLEGSSKATSTNPK